MSAVQPDSNGQIALMIEALLDRDGDEWGRRVNSLGDDLAFTAMLGTATVAIFRRWPGNPSDSEISEYAATVSARSAQEGTPVSAVGVEALISGALGQPLMIRGLGAQTLLPASAYLVHSIQDDGYLPDSARAEFIAEVVSAMT